MDADWRWFESGFLAGASARWTNAEWTAAVKTTLCDACRVVVLPALEFGDRDCPVVDVKLL